MKIVWHDAAVRELEEASLYYGGIDDVLGDRFTSAAEVAIAGIKARPEMSRKFDGQARKVRLQRFPYAVVYWFDGDTLRILSVMHLHREPGYWHRRTM
jgi:plasmid stabilization system protein ParE